MNRRAARIQAFMNREDTRWPPLSTLLAAQPRMPMCTLAPTCTTPAPRGTHVAQQRRTAHTATATTPPAAAQSPPRRRPPPGEFRLRIRVPPRGGAPGTAGREVRSVAPGTRRTPRGTAPPQERAAALHRRTADSRGAPHARRPRAHAAAFRPRLASAECPSDRRLYRWCVTRDPDGAQSRRARDRILARIAGK